MLSKIDAPWASAIAIVLTGPMMPAPGRGRDRAPR
jgi:hypothetical protein